MERHGATGTSKETLIDEGQIIWQIGSNDKISETCIHAEEMMSCAARNCRDALDFIARMERAQDRDLSAALGTYVQNTCEAMKQVDNALEKKRTNLAKLLFEVPGGSSDDMSWRNLIARQEVMAHKLLTLDDEGIQSEVRRDLGALYELLSRVYFVPVETRLEDGRGFRPRIEVGAMRQLQPCEPGTKPVIGRSLIFIFEDEADGFSAFRLGLSTNDTILLAGPSGSRNLGVGFASTGLAANSDSYDTWFRAKVREALDDPRPSIPHADVMADMRKMIADKQRATSRMATRCA